MSVVTWVMTSAFSAWMLIEFSEVEPNRRIRAMLNGTNTTSSWSPPKPLPLGASTPTTMIGMLRIRIVLADRPTSVGEQVGGDRLPDHRHVARAGVVGSVKKPPVSICQFSICW